MYNCLLPSLSHHSGCLARLTRSILALFPCADGGLLAFAFDPLRNAMIDCDKLLLFLEVFDDPAPLGRVWCLDELRIALLLGKEVEIIMPPQAMRSLKRRVSQEDGKSSVMDDIDRVVTRIDVTRKYLDACPGRSNPPSLEPFFLGVSIALTCSLHHSLPRRRLGFVCLRSRICPEAGREHDRRVRPEPVLQRDHPESARQGGRP